MSEAIWYMLSSDFETTIKLLQEAPSQKDNTCTAEVVESAAAAVAMDSDTAVAAAASALEPESAAAPSPAGKKASGRKKRQKGWVEPATD